MANELEGRIEQFEKYIAMVDAKLKLGGYRAGTNGLGREGVVEAEHLFRAQTLRNSLAKVYDDYLKNFEYSIKKMK